MEEVKATEGKIKAEKENDTIDIYLFSNGQQYSPPRKYHLRVEELRYWETTLGFLARSQYGSLHSVIDLFELDGRKVQSAAYIRDCAVYVAVVPPDPFIYSGYDKYLVKATRSYEKRLSKRTNGELSSPDETPSCPPVIKDNELRPQYPNIRKNCEARKSMLKSSSQKLTERIKPVANQISQRSNIPRKFNPNPSDIAAKKIYNSKKDTPRNNARMNTAPGVPGRSSTTDRGGSVTKSKSPAKTLSFELSTHRIDDINLKFANSRPTFDDTDTKIPDTDNKSRNTSNPNNESSTNKPDPISSFTRDSAIDEVHKKSANHPNASINTLKSSSENVSKITEKEQISAIDKTPNSMVDGRTQERISFTNKIRSEADKTPIPHVHTNSLVTDGTPSIVQQLRAPTSNERKTNKTNISDVIRELSKKFTTSESTDNSQGSVKNESKISKKKEMPILPNKYQDSDINKTRKSSINQISKSHIAKTNTSINNKTMKLNREVTKIQDNIINEQVNVGDATRSPSIDEISELTIQESLISTPKDQSAAINDIKSSSSFEVINSKYTRNTLNKDKTLKTNLDLISILNETRVSTEPQSIILKTGDETGSKNKDKILIINETSDQAIKLKIYETTKSTNVDPCALINQMKVTKVEATPNFNDSIVVKQENEIKAPKSSKLQTDAEKQNSNEQPNLHPENVNDRKVPILYHAPEKTLKCINSVGTSVTDSNNITNDNALSSPKAYDITIETDDVNSTKANSFTFYIKKGSNPNSLKLANLKEDAQQMVNFPITNIIKDKDIVHINIFRNSVSEATSSFENTDITSCKTPGCKDQTNDDEDCPSECYVERSTEQEGVLTTFLNPKWGKNSCCITNKTPTSSKNVTNDQAEPNTEQFIALVNNGDIIDLKLSIQVKNAQGVLKTTQNIDIRKSISVHQIENDESNKAPNELGPHLCCRKDVVVYQCECCNEGVSEGKKLILSPLNPDNQGLYILIPIAPPTGEGQQGLPTELLTRGNIVSLVKERLPGDGDKVPDRNMSNISQGTKGSETSSKPQVSIVDQEIMQSQWIIVRTDPSQTSSQYNVTSKLQQTSTSTQNRGSQTDWCDVLLEARPEPDGHYTFYLPPLYLLRQYALQ